MEFKLSEEQMMLKESARDFFRTECGKEIVKEVEKSEKGYRVDLWRKMADLGWMGLIIPEEYGGIGGSFLDLVVLLEEMGYNTCPSPFFASAILGTLPIIAFGQDEQKKNLLPGLASGELILTLALNEKEGFEASNIKAKALASAPEEGWSLSGTKLFVPYAHVADHILWVGRTTETADPENGLSVFLVDAASPGITRTPLKTLARDFHCEVEFDRVRISGKNTIGQTDQGWTVMRDILEKATLALSAEMIGGAQAAFDMALSYAKERVQFDHPIGSFQAIQHYLANMWLDVFASRILLYKAACLMSEGKKAALQVAMAKARIGETYRRVTMFGHQIFGAIGFCEELNFHLYHRRAMCWDLSFGDTDFQREKVARQLLDL